MQLASCRAFGAGASSWIHGAVCARERISEPYTCMMSRRRPVAKQARGTKDANVPSSANARSLRRAPLKGEEDNETRLEMVRCCQTPET
jgi:hypothetical protein